MGYNSTDMVGCVKDLKISVPGNRTILAKIVLALSDTERLELFLSPPKPAGDCTWKVDSM